MPTVESISHQNVISWSFIDCGDKVVAGCIGGLEDLGCPSGRNYLRSMPGQRRRPFEHHSSSASSQSLADARHWAPDTPPQFVEYRVESIISYGANDISLILDVQFYGTQLIHTARTYRTRIRADR